MARNENPDSEISEENKKSGVKRKSIDEDSDTVEKEFIVETQGKSNFNFKHVYILKNFWNFVFYLKLLLLEELTKSKKRKQPKEESTESKRSKKSDEENSGDEADQPTAEQLKESEKPENQPDIQTVRQKKKKKHQKNVEMSKESSEQREILKNSEYLNKWKHNKDSWKFEKLRQISIQNNCLDQSKMSDEIWEIAAEYLSGTKGAAKTKICEMAEKTIEKLDDEIQKTNDKSLVSSVSYKRARELLQSLD